MYMCVHARSPLPRHVKTRRVSYIPAKQGKVASFHDDEIMAARVAEATVQGDFT